MSIALRRPFKPMEALSVDEIREGNTRQHKTWQYEPKWDGFHFSGGRFRHGTRLLRWRPDKAPRQCTMDQVRQKKADLVKLLG